MEVRSLKPISTRDEYITLRAVVARQARNLVDIAVEIYSSDGTLCPRASWLYFLFPKDKAREEFHFCECSVEEQEVDEL